MTTIFDYTRTHAVRNRWHFCSVLIAAESQDHEVLHEIPNAPSNNLGCEPGVKMSHVVLAVSLVRIEMHVLVVLV